MRRKLILAVLILLAFVLQGTVFQTLSIASIVPNLLLILTVSFGFMRGKKEGMFVGFFCGLLIDIFYGSMIGFYALIYMYIGFGNGFLYKIFFDEDVKVPMVLVAGSDIAYGVLVYGLQFMLRGPAGFFQLSAAYYSSGDGIYSTAYGSFIPTALSIKPLAYGK